MSRVGRLLRLIPDYAETAWWGLVHAPRQPGGRIDVAQGVIFDADRVLLTVRSDLYGWELPGGNPEPGESLEEALLREVDEETGLRVAIERPVGVYHRTGFLPHRAHVFRCRVLGGALRPSVETPGIAWFARGALPDTLFPWYRAPLADALEPDAPPVERREHQGIGAVLAGARIDLKMRWRGAPGLRAFGGSSGE